MFVFYIKQKQNVQILFCAINFILGNKNQKLTFTILFFIFFLTFVVWVVLVIFTTDLSGEGIRHHFPVGPVAHHHASPHQENHTGR